MSAHHLNQALAHIRDIRKIAGEMTLSSEYYLTLNELEELKVALGYLHHLIDEMWKGRKETLTANTWTTSN